MTASGCLKALSAAAAAIAAMWPLAAAAAEEAPRVVVPVAKLAAAPTVDGDLADWAGAQWTRIAVHPADDKVENKAVGLIEVDLAVGVAGDSVYLAARWPDAAEDADYRPWRWNGKAYKRGEERDDMFAVRFHLDGDYDRCMIAEKTYRVDLWVWSAGRSNAAGIAEDLTHAITTDLTESAAEFKGPSGATIFIRKIKDDGDPAYETTKPGKTLTEERLPSIGPATASGSAADIAARGQWHDGTWRMEMARKLDTGHADDAVLGGGRRIAGAVAVFNRSHSENKSVSDLLVFDFTAAQ